MSVGDVALVTQQSGVTIPVETGTIQDFGMAAIPNGWLACDGSAVSRATYATLFAKVSTTWGSGDGSTTFNLPDMRGRTRIGSGTGSGLTARALAAKTGAETVALSTGEMPTHSHTVAAASDGGIVAGNIQLASSGNTYHFAGTGQGSGSSASAGSGTAHNNMQPSIVATVGIKT